MDKRDFSSNPPESEIFRQAASCTWANVSIYLDPSIPALVLQLELPGNRGHEVLLSAEQGLELALKLAGASERLRLEAVNAPPRWFDRRKRPEGAA